jgi:hypothetical protein
VPNGSPPATKRGGCGGDEALVGLEQVAGRGVPQAGVAVGADGEDAGVVEREAGARARAPPSLRLRISRPDTASHRCDGVVAAGREHGGCRRARSRRLTIGSLWRSTIGRCTGVFYVVSSKTLDEKLGTQKSIVLSRLVEIGALPVGYADLKASITDAFTKTK